MPPAAGTVLLGTWEPPFQHPPHVCVNPAFPFAGFNAVHVCLIPDDPAIPNLSTGWEGKVLVWDKSESTPACGASTAGDYGQRWAIVDPETDQVLHTATFIIPEVDAPLATAPLPGTGPRGFQGLFCSSHCWLRDGRLFVAGGDDWTQRNADPLVWPNPNPVVEYGGSALVCVFDPQNQANPWSVLKAANQQAMHLRARRWYPSVVRLADLNDTVIVAGGVETFDLNANIVRPIEEAHETYEAFQTHFINAPGQILRDTVTAGGGIVVPAGQTIPAGFTSGLFLGPQIFSSPVNHPNTNYSFYYFPRLHLASRDTLGGAQGQLGLNGRLWMAAMPAQSLWMDHIAVQMQLAASMSVPSTGTDLLVEEPATVLLPNYPSAFKDVIVAIGGGQGGTHQDVDITDKVWMLDTKAATPTWFQSPTMKMHYRRKFHKAVLLPDTSILVLGGGQNSGHGVGSDNCYWPEVFLDGAWQLCAKEGTMIPNDPNPPLDQGSPRTYHSSALLLPSGKVLSCGGDTRQFDYQVFRPHYWKEDPADRPQWGTALPKPTQIYYGGQFDFSFVVPPMQTIERVVLTTPGSWTHAQDPGQRCVVLDFSVEEAGTCAAIGPPSPSDAPPGLYMLWMVSTAGVPSVATWVRVG